jgi:hypothetical protein
MDIDCFASDDVLGVRDVAVLTGDDRVLAV